jgi:hypothetical protein
MPASPSSVAKHPCVATTSGEASLELEKNAQNFEKMLKTATCVKIYHQHIVHKHHT